MNSDREKCNDRESIAIRISVEDQVLNMPPHRIPQFFIGFESQERCMGSKPLFQLIKLLLANTLNELKKLIQSNREGLIHLMIERDTPKSRIHAFVGWGIISS